MDKSLSYQILCGQCGRFGCKGRVIGEVRWINQFGVAALASQVNTRARGSKVEVSISRPHTYVDLLGDVEEVEFGRASFTARCGCGALYEFRQEQLTTTFEDMANRDGPAAVAGQHVGTLIEMVRGI